MGALIAVLTTVCTVALLMMLVAVFGMLVAALSNEAVRADLGPGTGTGTGATGIADTELETDTGCCANIETGGTGIETAGVSDVLDGTLISLTLSVSEEDGSVVCAALNGCVWD
jgi:hypothetical protein